ncbi:MAG TPA: hypothetical protein VKH37_06430, partial [Ferruginibacter sp.]|nr:hypothetical protein [Ferruginibacter sp.]
MSVTLIANSGIQFHKFDLSLNPNEDLIKPVGFYEFLDEVNEKISLQYAYYLPDLDIWVPKSILKEEDYLDDNDRVKENVNFNILKNFALREAVDYFTISDINDCMEIFASRGESMWLP